MKRPAPEQSRQGGVADRPLQEQDLTGRSAEGAPRRGTGGLVGLTLGCLMLSQHAPSISRRAHLCTVQCG